MRPTNYPISEVVRVALDLSEPEAVRAVFDREIVRYAAWKREAERLNGLAFITDPFEPKTVAQLRAIAAAEIAKRDDFRAPPRGQLMACIKELTEVGYHEVEAVRNIYTRCLADARQPVDAEAVMRAVRILNHLNHPEARKAIDALCSLVAPGFERAA